MKYRTLGRTGMQVSEIGLGCEHLQGLGEEEVFAVVDEAIRCGVNLLDVFMSEPNVRTNIGKALQGRRSRVLLQGHLCSAWLDGQYSRDRNLDNCKFFFEDFMERLGTDYVDIGMLHFVDTEEDFRSVFETEIIRYALDLKEKGVIGALGMSSHSPVIAARAVETGLIDVLLFSLNPAYDLLPESASVDDLFTPESYRVDGLNGIHPARDRLYRLCEGQGTAITVMKALAAGVLLNAETSPFGVALTPAQCIHYALTRPAVANVLPGCSTPAEVRRSVAYEEASEQERDYSVVLSQMPKYSMRGKCMYCNHCLPCPAHIDIAQVNKYLDLAQASAQAPDTVRAHYGVLEQHASDCIRCGSCERNCPFDVPVRSRMQTAQELFGL